MTRRSGSGPGGHRSPARVAETTRGRRRVAIPAPRGGLARREPRRTVAVRCSQRPSAWRPAPNRGTPAPRRDGRPARRRGRVPRGRPGAPPASGSRRRSRDRCAPAAARASARPRRCAGRRRPADRARPSGGSPGTGTGSPSPRHRRAAVARAARSRPRRGAHRSSGGGTRASPVAAGPGGRRAAAGWSRPSGSGRPAAASRSPARCRSRASRREGCAVRAPLGVPVRPRDPAAAAGPAGTGCPPTSRCPPGTRGCPPRWRALSSRCPGRAGERPPVAGPGAPRAVGDRQAGASWGPRPGRTHHAAFG